MSKNLSIIAVMLLLHACKSGSDKIPDYALNKDEFSDLLVDFTLAESAANINVLNVTGLKGDTVYAFNPLLDRNVSKQKFDTTLYYYSHNPEQFKEVYALVLEKLNKLQTSRK